MSAWLIAAICVALVAAPWIINETGIALFNRRERRNGFELTGAQKARLRHAFWAGFASVGGLGVGGRRR